MDATTVRLLRRQRSDGPALPACPPRDAPAQGEPPARDEAVPARRAPAADDRVALGVGPAAIRARANAAARVAAAAQTARSAGEARGTGRVAVDLTGDRASKRSFLFGAAGEREVAATLERLAGDRSLFLHHRRRGSGSVGGTVDHIAITPAGVWVIDAHHYAGAKVRVWVTGGIVGPPEHEQLMIRGCDRTSLVDDLAWQEVAVRRTLSPYGIRVRALLCFLDADLPMFALPTIRGYSVLGARDTGRRLRQGGPLDEDQRQEIWETLSRALPSA